MELQRYLEILKRRAIVILIVAAATVAVVAVAGLLTTPSYKANATVRVIQDVGVLDLNIRETYGERLMNTYGAILTGWPVLEQAAERLDSPLTARQLEKKVAVEVIPDTELMSIIAQDQDPVFARDLANTLAQLLVEHAQGLYTGSEKSALQIVEEQLAGMENSLAEDRQKLTTLLATDAPSSEIEAVSRQIQFKEDAYDRLLDRYELARLNESLRANSISIVAPAQTPRKPANSLGLTQIGLGLILGLFAGVGLALVLENLDTRIHSHHQLESFTHVPVLGTVPKGLLPANEAEQADQGDSRRPITEAYRLLGTNLQALREEIPFKTVLITSAVAGEGKSTTAANLAQALAERGQTVFLVESDLRRPVIAGVLDLNGSGKGLGNLLSERPSLNGEFLGQIIQPAQLPNLFVIVGGPQLASPTALLASPPMEELLGYLGAQGQTTVLDAPPVLGVADVSVLAPRVDGVILVVRQAQSKREHVLAALKQLKASRARVLGFVFLQRSGQDWSYD